TGEGQASGDAAFELGHGCPHIGGGRVDTAGGVVAEQVAGGGGQDPHQLGVRGWQPDDQVGRPYPLGALVAEHHGPVSVGGEDLHFLDQVGHLVGWRAGHANQHERLSGEIDVFLVLHGVGGDRLVAQFRELDADLGGCPPVG